MRFTVVLTIVLWLSLTATGFLFTRLPWRRLVEQVQADVAADPGIDPETRARVAAGSIDDMDIELDESLIWRIELSNLLRNWWPFWLCLALALSYGIARLVTPGSGNS